MERIRTIFLLVPLVMACDGDTAFDPLLDGSDHPLIKTWTYESVVYQQDTVTLADFDFEPNILTADLLPGLLLSRRHVEYAPDQSYQLSWDLTGDYILSDSVHFQPDLGFWIIRGDSLIHNPEQYYEFGYKIVELLETRFVRQSNRVMKTTVDSTRWLPGDAILFTEIFVPRE